jgi:hypothetical protein
VKGSGSNRGFHRSKQSSFDRSTLTTARSTITTDLRLFPAVSSSLEACAAPIAYCGSRGSYCSGYRTIAGFQGAQTTVIIRKKSVCLSCASITHSGYAADTQPIRLIPQSSRFHPFDVFALDTQPIRLIPQSIRFHPFDVFASDLVWVRSRYA